MLNRFRDALRDEFEENPAKGQVLDEQVFGSLDTLEAQRTTSAPVAELSDDEGEAKKPDADKKPAEGGKK